MGGRYVITGVQLGMLKAHAISGVKNGLLAILEEIEGKQYMGNSDRSIAEDVSDLLRTKEG